MNQSGTSNHINVVYSTNAKYIPHLAASIASLLHNMAPQDTVSIHVLHADLDQPTMDKLTQVGKLASGRCDMAFHVIQRESLNRFPERGRITLESYYRLQLQDIFTDIDRIIYLDVDILIRSSLAEFWNTPLGDNVLAGVEETYDLAKVYQKHGMITGHCFNAGILLCNLKAMRAEPLWDKYMQFMNDFELVTGDQDILNQVFDKRVVIVHPKWNHSTSIYRYPENYTQYSQEQLREARENPAIVHFTGRRKPWHLKRDRHPYAMEYWNYLAMTPWRGQGWKKYLKKIIFGSLKNN